MSLALRVALSSASFLAVASVAVAQTPPLRKTDFVAIGGTSNAVTFASPQLITRNGAVTTATMIFVVDPPSRNGTVTASQTEWIWCADGQVQIKLQVSRDAAGKEISRQEPTSPPAKPEAGTIADKFAVFACTGKLPDPQAARYATIEEAIAGARAILARNRGQP